MYRLSRWLQLPKRILNSNCVPLGLVHLRKRLLNLPTLPNRLLLQRFDLIYFSYRRSRQPLLRRFRLVHVLSRAGWLNDRNWCFAARRLSFNWILLVKRYLYYLPRGLRLPQPRPDKWNSMSRRNLCPYNRSGRLLAMPTRLLVRKRRHVFPYAMHFRLFQLRICYHLHAMPCRILLPNSCFLPNCLPSRHEFHSGNGQLPTFEHERITHDLDHLNDWNCLCCWLVLRLQSRQSYPKMHSLPYWLLLL